MKGQAVCAEVVVLGYERVSARRLIELFLRLVIHAVA